MSCILSQSKSKDEESYAEDEIDPPETLEEDNDQESEAEVPTAPPKTTRKPAAFIAVTPPEVILDKTAVRPPRNEINPPKRPKSPVNDAEYEYSAQPARPITLGLLHGLSCPVFTVRLVMLGCYPAYRTLFLVSLGSRQLHCLCSGYSLAQVRPPLRPYRRPPPQVSTLQIG